MKKVLSIAAVVLVLTSCGGANDGDATTDTTSTLPMDPAINSPVAADSISNTGIYPNDSLRDTSSGFSSSPTNEQSRNSTPGGKRNKNDTTRQ